MRVAVPVEAQDGGVVAQLPPTCVDDGLCQVLDGLPRMQVSRSCQDGRDVHGCRVALEHAVGEKDEPIARLQGYLLHASGAIALTFPASAI